MGILSALEGVLPDKARKYVYALFAVVSLVLAFWKASDGQWFDFTVLLVGTTTGTLATANTDTGENTGKHSAD